MAKQAFVTGWPIKHSRSPLIHSFWLKQHNLLGSYQKYACAPDDFKDFLKNLKSHGFIGGNVTIPHKEAAFDYVDHRDATAEKLGAVNTVWYEGDQLHGSNTDGYGFLANLDDRASGWDRVEKQQRGALVLGAGGAARPIVYGLLERGFENIIIANRTVERAEELALKFSKKCMASRLDQLPPSAFDVSFIVNTTSVGMNSSESPLDLKAFAQDCLVNDIVYTPLTTALLQQANDLGMQTVDGLGMLLHQAVPGFEKWFGIRPKVSDELRQIVLQDIGEQQ